MHEGEIAECRAAQVIFTDPQHPYTRSLIAALPTPAALLAGKGAATLQPSAKSHVVGCG
jgi:ABC-type oligopeptide transport system ATPase subunit